MFLIRPLSSRKNRRYPIDGYFGGIQLVNGIAVRRYVLKKFGLLMVEMVGALIWVFGDLKVCKA